MMSDFTIVSMDRSTLLGCMDKFFEINEDNVNEACLYLASAQLNHVPMIQFLPLQKKFRNVVVKIV